MLPAKMTGRNDDSHRDGNNKEPQKKGLLLAGASEDDHGRQRRKRAKNKRARRFVGLDENRAAANRERHSNDQDVHNS